RAVMVTLISALSPFATVISSGVETVIGTCLAVSSLRILVSVCSENQARLFGPMVDCSAFAIPQVADSAGQAAQFLFWDGIQYSVRVSFSVSMRAILLPKCSLNHIEPSCPVAIQYGSVYAFAGVLPP